jgi:ABC-type nitrate/sulfonate/bicarbonate transport system permease component
MVTIGILGVLIDSVFRVVNRRFAWGGRQADGS